jgi:uncharacterized protein with FMN-binding domain
MLDLDIKIDEKELQQIGFANRLLEHQIKAAARRAVTKTTRWVMAQAKRLLRSKTQMNLGAIRSRLGEFRKTEFSRKVWMGLNAVPANAFGKPTQTASGVRVGKRNFDGAFVIRKFNDGVYKRRTKDRFPLEKVTVNIEKESTDVFNQIKKEADARFIKVLMQEINFEVVKANKAGR